MYLKIAVISLVIAVPVFILGAFVELGATSSSLSQMTFWTSHIFGVLSYVVVAVLASYLASLSFPASGSSNSGSSLEDKEKGQVKWFNSSKGYGFITRDQGDDVFVHYRSILGKGHRALYEGQSVAFVVTEGDKGLQADEVEVLSGGPKNGKRR